MKSAKTKPDSTYQAAHKLRKTLPPDKLADWNPGLRQRTVADLLAETLHDRLPELAPIRWQRMAASAFGFFRGSAAVMAYDLSLLPNTAIHAQLCGDSHVLNLGAFEGVDGRLVFDINDFDETLAGPFEWDLKRMTTSILLAGHEAGIKPGAALDAAEHCLAAYTILTRRLLAMPVLDVARYQVHRLSEVAPISKILMKAERATPAHSLESLTVPARESRRFRSEPPLLLRVDDIKERSSVLAALIPYIESLLPERHHIFARFTPFDVAIKIVGTGSVGLRDYVVYFEGKNPGSGTDPLFLQIKQESHSCYAAYLPSAGASHQGQRVVEGQRAMQVQSDPLLGWTRIGKNDYLVRQLNDHKAAVDLTDLRARDLVQYASVCGEILARGHARSGDVRQIAGYIGNGKRFAHAIVGFAETYAAQTRKDWHEFCKSYPADPIEARSS